MTAVTVSPFAPRAISLIAQAYDLRKSGEVPARWAKEVLSDIDVYWVQEVSLCYLLIPGTDSGYDWRHTNLWGLPTRIEGVPGKWREGYRTAGEFAWRFAARRLPSAEGPTKLVIVGHSLGGATAAVVGALAARDGWAPRVALLLLLAAPRTTNQVGADYLNKHYPPEVGQRIAFEFDLVPFSVPPFPFPWRHALKNFYVSPNTLEISEKVDLTRWVRLLRVWRRSKPHQIQMFLRWVKEKMLPDISPSGGPE